MASSNMEKSSPTADGKLITDENLVLAYSQALKLLLKGQQEFPLTLEGATDYYHHAKATLGEQQFQKLVSLMDKREEKMAVKTRLLRICQVLQGYPDLIQRFGMFLPPNVNLRVQTGGLTLEDIPKGEEEDEVTVKIEEVSESENETESPSQSEKAKSETPMDVDPSEDGHSADKTTASKEDRDHGSFNFLNKVKLRFEKEPEVYSSFLSLLITVRNNHENKQVARDLFETQVFYEVCELFEGHEDLIEEFKMFVPSAVYEQNEEDPSKSSITLLESTDKENPRSSPEAVEELKFTPVNDPSVAPVYIYGSFEEHAFFDEVRTAVAHRDVYDNFLRCLMMYNEDFITRTELIKLTTSFLGKFPNLHKRLKEMLGYNESGSNMERIPMKIINIENKRKRHEIGLDIDYSNGGRNGASYRALPKDFDQPTCSGRSPLCKEVLNDTWVSFPSWSEDSTFVTSCKTQYEEIIYRCEDERFELDMAINANTNTMVILQEIQKKMNKMNYEERTGTRLDDTLNTGGSIVLHQKALHRLYGDKTHELVEGLKRNPWVAVPIILKRLRAKDEEWRDRQRRYNEVWRAQIDHYFLKSLDHQGINFKQTDNKSFRPKSLEKEMEMVYAEKKESKGFNSSHFVLEFTRMEVFQDAINLMLQYVKKIPGVYRDDRRKIELVIRSFIPDFFSAPRSTLSGDDLEAEEESREPDEPMDFVKEEDERSGQTSPAASTRDDVSSDLDESISNSEDNSEETDKSFAEEIDVFDKIDPLPVPNLPYTLFFASKTWYIFFRQFHILCDRLSRLMFESNRQSNLPISELYMPEDNNSETNAPPTYPQLIDKLSLLLNGSIDYAEFEEEARHLFGIHAFVSYTMDKLILSIVRQLQKVVTDDLSKQCTLLFVQNCKFLTSGGLTSPLEAAHMEHDYWKRAGKDFNEEQRCFKVVWHKKEHTITIELMEQEIKEEHFNPIEAEKWSNYLDDYVTDDCRSEDIVEEGEELPVFLPRNLRKMKAYWKRKVAEVEKSWQTQQSAKSQKRSLMTNRKRRALALLSHSLTKMLRRSNSQKDISEPTSDKPDLIEDSKQPAEDKNTPAPEEQKSEATPEPAVEDHSEDNSVIIMEDVSEKEDILVVEISEDHPEVQEESVEIKVDDAPMESPVIEKGTESPSMLLEENDDSSPLPVQEETEAMAVDDDSHNDSSKDDESSRDDKSTKDDESSKDDKSSKDDESSKDEDSSQEEDVEEEKDDSNADVPDATDSPPAIEEVVENVSTEMDLSSRIDDAVETASRIMETVVQEATSDQDVIDEEEDKSEDESEKSEDESEKSENESEKSKDESEKSENESEKSKDESEKSEDESEKSEDESEKSEEESQKSEGSLKGRIEQKSGVDVVDDSKEEEASDQECIDKQEEKSESGSSKSESGSSKSEESLKRRTRQNASVDVVDKSKEDDSEMSDQECEDKQEEKSEEESPKTEEPKKPRKKRNIEAVSSDKSEEEEDIASDNQECEDKREEKVSSEEESPKSSWTKRPLRKKPRRLETVELEAKSDQDKENDRTTTEEDSPSKSGLLKRRIRHKPYDYSVRTRRNRSNQTYMRKKMKRGIVRTIQNKSRRRNRKPKLINILDDPKFDYMYFSELSPEERVRHLVFMYLSVKDDVEVSFKPGGYKIHFVQGCNLYLHRDKSLTKAKEAHQSISEIKTSNFNAWHRVWLDRYVTTSMLKYCNDWLMKSDPESYKLVRMHISDCKKPPYIPYYKYKLRHYLIDSQ